MTQLGYEAALRLALSPPVCELFGDCGRDAAFSIWWRGRWAVSCLYHAEMFDL